MENNKEKEVSVVEKVMGTLSENKLFDEVADVDFSESEKVKGFAKVYGYVKEIHDSSEDINIDRLKFKIFLHDIGKIQEYKFDMDS